jgi:hypothetical protein
VVADDEQRDDAPWSAGARLYSGRVDPSWSVEATRARAIVALFRTLQPSTRVHPDAGGIGYRGCWLRAPDGAAWVVANGLAAERAPRRDEVRSDAQRAFERAILDTAPDGVLPPGVKPV